MKYMKIFAVLTTIFLLMSCGKKSEIINSELSREITDNVEFSEQLTQIDTINAQKRYMLSSKDYSEITAFVGTASVCDEFVIVKTTDTEGITEDLRSYIDSKKESYKTYRPNEIYKLDNAIIEQYEDAVVMIITADSDDAIRVYEEYLKK